MPRKYYRRKANPKRFPYCTIPRTRLPVHFWNVPPEFLALEDKYIIIRVRKTNHMEFYYPDWDTGEMKYYDRLTFTGYGKGKMQRIGTAKRWVFTGIVKCTHTKTKTYIPFKAEAFYDMELPGPNYLTTYLYLTDTKWGIPYGYWNTSERWDRDDPEDLREASHIFVNWVGLWMEPWKYYNRTWIVESFNKYQLAVGYMITDRYLDRWVSPRGNPFKEWMYKREQGGEFRHPDYAKRWRHLREQELHGF